MPYSLKHDNHYSQKPSGKTISTVRVPQQIISLKKSAAIYALILYSTLYTPLNNSSSSSHRLTKLTLTLLSAQKSHLPKVPQSSRYHSLSLSWNLHTLLIQDNMGKDKMIEK